MSEKTQDSNASKLYDSLNPGAAPAVHTKAHFEDDLVKIRHVTGVSDFKSLFGSRELSDNDKPARQVNFGSKREVGGLEEHVRLRLFGLKRLISAAEIQAQIETRSLNPGAAAIMATPVYKQHLEAMLKAFNITDFATWIPTVNTRFFFEEYEIPLALADLFDQLPMESASMHVPGALGRLMGMLEGDAGVFTAQSNTEAGFDVRARNNVVHTQITEDLNQDAAPAIIDKLRREVLMGIGRAEERTLLNGDDSNTHMDADVTDAKDFRKAYKGLRKVALANSANGVVYDHKGDTASKALFANMLKSMGKFASEKGDLAWILPPSLANDLVTGAIPELFTAFAFGGPASNVTGQVPPVFGIKPVESEWVREDVDATGVYTTSGKTFTTALLVKKSRFANYLRQPTRVWAAPALPSSDLMLMSGKKRHAWAGNPQSANEKSVVIGINVQTSPT